MSGGYFCDAAGGGIFLCEGFTARRINRGKCLAGRGEITRRKCLAGRGEFTRSKGLVRRNGFPGQRSYRALLGSSVTIGLAGTAFGRARKETEMKNAYFAGGCFWCIAAAFGGIEGIAAVVSGYCGGEEDSPSYEDVKAQKTGHRECIKITYDEAILSYGRLLDVYFENVDPFDGEGQFIDRGRSYTLAIYTDDEREKSLAEGRIDAIEKCAGRPVYVAVEPLRRFFTAEEYHQDFHVKNPGKFKEEIESSGREKRKEELRQIMNRENVLDRFLRYARIPTGSSDKTGTTPSTEKQFVLGRMLRDELLAIGVNDAECDAACYVYGHIPATPGYESAPAIGFIAHMDTAPDFSGDNVSPRIVADYDGGDIVLGDSGRTITNENFPHLAKLKGKTLVVTDGKSLLGGDDKAGVAEIIAALSDIVAENIPHGRISVAFTPDEEIGEGADHFDLGKFAADFAYTVDGGPVCGVEYETFNAAAAVFEVKGFNVHPGTAKDIMINAQLVAMEINGMLPAGETPRDTEGYEGFFHLCEMEGNVERARLEYIVRDHDDGKFELRKAILKTVAARINEKYGPGTATLTVREQYRNMARVIRENMHLIDNALEVMRELGIEGRTEPIRGGTDGARLSYMGLPCPNLGDGDYAAHGPYEHVVVEEMEQGVEIIKGLVRRYAGAC